MTFKPVRILLILCVLPDLLFPGTAKAFGDPGETTVELVNSCSRMMDLLDAPRDISFFSKLIQREIIYRLLQGSQGARLRAIATFETKCHRTAKAVAWLRSNYEKPLRVEDLATIAGMSRSTLHLHFRALTAMSPLQFQKQLRLHAAAATHAHG
jgi:transcriptional regulator GlxA family with amidase domain